MVTSPNTSSGSPAQRAGPRFRDGPTPLESIETGMKASTAPGISNVKRAVRTQSIDVPAACGDRTDLVDTRSEPNWRGSHAEQGSIDPPLSVHDASSGQDIGGDLADGLHCGLGQRVVVHRAGYGALGKGGVQEQTEG